MCHRGDANARWWGTSSLRTLDVSSASAQARWTEGWSIRAARPSHRVGRLILRKGSRHIAVSNAGITTDNLLLRVSDEEVSAVCSTNVHGAIWLARAAVRSMMRALRPLHRGVFGGGADGQRGPRWSTRRARAPSRAMVQSLAREYGSRGVTANVVAPGFIDTDMTASLGEELRAIHERGPRVSQPLGPQGIWRQRGPHG